MSDEYELIKTSECCFVSGDAATVLSTDLRTYAFLDGVMGVGRDRQSAMDSLRRRLWVRMLRPIPAGKT